MRMLFVWIVVLGVVGSAFTHLPSRRSPSPEELLVNASGAESATDAATNSETTASQDGSLDLPRSPDGHFYADVDVNGTKIHMLVDTGATGVALSREDARSAGIATSIGMPNVVAEGADGGIHGEYVKVDRMSLGSARAEGVEAIVLNNGGQSLLGQSFLARFASVEIHGDTMTLR
jgi:aspartyl protease family protein